MAFAYGGLTISNLMNTRIFYATIAQSCDRWYISISECMKFASGLRKFQWLGVGKGGGWYCF